MRGVSFGLRKMLGVLSHLTLLTPPAFVTYVLALTTNDGVLGGFALASFVAVFALILLTFALMGAYLLHLWLGEHVHPNAKPGWTIGLLVGTGPVLVLYWWRFIRGSQPPREARRRE